MKRILSVLLLSLSLVLLGCSKQDKNEDFSQEVSGELHTIGEETTKSQKIQLTNKTGMTIEAFFVKNNKTNKPSDNLMIDNEFTQRQRRNFFYEFKDGITYDIQIQSDGQSYNLHEIPFEEMTEATLMKEDDLVYLEYVNKDGETVSTKEFEENYVPPKKEEEKKQKQTQSDKPVFVIEEPVEEEQQETTTTETTTETTQPTETQEPVVVNPEPVVETPTTTTTETTQQ